MDEPLSNLAAKMRVVMRAEIARLQRELAVTTVYVAHDQIEAMTMGGTRVAVLRDGRLQQVDTPQRLYDEPVNLSVATFIGSPATNVFAASVEQDGDDGQAVRLGHQRPVLDPAVVAAHRGVRARVGGTVVLGIRREGLEDVAVDPGVPAERVVEATVDLVGSLGAELIVHSVVTEPPALDAGPPPPGDEVAGEDVPDDEVAEAWRQVVARRGRAVARARVVVDNDVDLAAVGAAAALGCRGDLAYLSIGTGLAAGLVLDGRIRPGAHGAAGEIGRLPIDPQGPRCECGQRGCLEAVASGTAIAARWPSPDGPLTAASSLLTAAAAGDAAAQALLAEVAGHLAGAVALPAQTVDPEIVVLGGGVADAGPGLLTAVQQARRARAALSPVLAAIHLAERVALVPRGVPAGAVGAAVLARRQLVERATPAEPQVAGPSAVESDTT